MSVGSVSFSVFSFSLKKLFQEVFVAAWFPKINGKTLCK